VSTTILLQSYMIPASTGKAPTAAPAPATP